MYCQKCNKPTKHHHQFCDKHYLKSNVQKMQIRQLRNELKLREREIWKLKRNIMVMQRDKTELKKRLRGAEKRCLN